MHPRLLTPLLLLVLLAPRNLFGVEEFILHDATPVRLRLTRNLSSADCTVGENVDFEVLDDVTIGDTLVIVRGATRGGYISGCMDGAMVMAASGSITHYCWAGRRDATADLARERAAARSAAQQFPGGAGSPRAPAAPHS